MGLADFKSVGGNLIAAGGSIPSPSDVKFRKGGGFLAEVDVKLTAHSRHSG